LRVTRRLLLVPAAVLLLAGWTAALTVGGFAVHMSAHVVAVAVAAPMLALAVRWRPRWLQKGAAPLAACAAEFVVVWGWHLPWLHAAARHSLPVFGLEQASFLAAGWAVWASALPSADGTSRSTALAGAGALLMTSMHMTLLGGLLTIVPWGWLQHTDGPDPLLDQQLGGAIMLGVGGLAYLAGALGLLARALREHASWRKPA
jgi:putative membrane protein